MKNHPTQHLSHPGTNVFNLEDSTPGVYIVQALYANGGIDSNKILKQ